MIREYREIARLLTIMPNRNIVNRLDNAPGVTKFDFGYRRISEGEYRLYINGKETEMRIYAMYPMTRSSSAGGDLEPSESPMLWIGEGAADGRREGRYYRSLDAAFHGESTLVNRAFVNGVMESILGDKK